MRHIVTSDEGKSRTAFGRQREVVPFSISRFKIPGSFAVCVLVVCPSGLFQWLDLPVD